MKELLLVEKSHSRIDSSTENKYVLEGLFTELGSTNRNGRVYTKEGFVPHMNLLSKVIEQGKCLGELDHPKVFETSLKNASHVIEKIWLGEGEEANKVFGRIKLLDTTAGKEAKALVDAGIPLHISSRAAGTVKEDKTVEMHKLFSYDLVADPGFENAVLATVNESYGFSGDDEIRNFFIFDVNESKKSETPTKTVANSAGPIDMTGYIKEEELQAFTAVANEQIALLKEQIKELEARQDALTVQADENSTADTNSLEERIEAIENWSNHVVEEFNTIDTSELEDKITAIEAWSDHVTESVTAIENWSEEATTTVTALENWSEEATSAVTTLENWSEDTKTTVSGLVEWSDEATKSVTVLEKWSEHVTESVTALENWSDEATKSVSKLEESANAIEDHKNTLLLENENREFDSYSANIYSKIDSIISAATTKKAEEEKEAITEAKEAAVKSEPVWMSLRPEKYGELWEALSEAKQNSIIKRANICTFATETSIVEFWDSMFAGVNLETIKESNETAKPSKESLTESADARRKAYIEQFNSTFGNKY